MRVEDYEQLPDGMTQEEVLILLEKFLRHEAEDSLADRYRMFEVICDRQWHCYVEQNILVKQRLENWINANWLDSQEFMRLALGICYSFGLSKALFQRILAKYRADDKWEYVDNLERSPGDTIDSYWSLR